MKICSFDIESTHYLEEQGQTIELGLVMIDTNKIKSLVDVHQTPKLRILVHNDPLHGNYEAIEMNMKVLKEINDLIKADKSLPFNQKKKNTFVNIPSNDPLLTTYLVDPFNFVKALVLWLHANNIYEMVNNPTDYKQRAFDETINMLKNTKIYANNWKSVYDDCKIYMDALLMAGKNIATFDLPFLRRTIPGFDTVIKVKKRIIDPAIIYTSANDIVPPDLAECKNRIGIKNTTVAHTGINDTIDINILLYFHFRLEQELSSFTIINKDNPNEYTIKVCATHDIQSEIEKHKSEDTIVITNQKLYEISMKNRLQVFHTAMEHANQILEPVPDMGEAVNNMINNG